MSATVGIQILVDQYGCLPAGSQLFRRHMETAAIRIRPQAERKTHLCRNRSIGRSSKLPGQRKLLELARIAKAEPPAAVQRFITQFSPPIGLIVRTPFGCEPRFLEAGSTHHAKTRFTAQAQAARTAAQAECDIEPRRRITAKGKFHLFPDHIGRCRHATNVERRARLGFDRTIAIVRLSIGRVKAVRY